MRSARVFWCGWILLTSLLPGHAIGQDRSSIAGNLTSVPEANLFSGGAAISIPIEIPAGRGLTPQLALTYSSSAGPSAYGYGWDLPLGKIQRRLKHGFPSCAFDGERDEFVLILPDGRTVEFRLVGDTGVPHLSEERYKIKADPSSNRWTVRDPAGITYYFGEGNSRVGGNPNSTTFRGSCSGLAVDDVVFSWGLSRAVDLNFNTIVIDYDSTTGTQRPVQISYGANLVTGHGQIFSISFGWEPRPPGDTIVNGSGGFAAKLLHRLQKIEVRYLGALLRSYLFTYDAPGERYGRSSLLRTVTQFAAGPNGVEVALARSDGSPASTTFAYHQNVPTAGELGIDDVLESAPSPSLPGPSRLSIADASGRSYVVRDIFDINGDGFVDLVDTYHLNQGNSGCSAATDAAWRVWFGSRAGFASNYVDWNVGQLPGGRHCYIKGASLDSNGVEVTRWETTDLSGDGITDFVDATGTTWQVFKGTASAEAGYGFVSGSLPFKSGVAATRLKKSSPIQAIDYDLADVNGDGLLDIVDTRIDDNQFRVRLNKPADGTWPGGFWPPDPEPALTFQAGGPDLALYQGDTQLADTLDINGDGIIDQVAWWPNTSELDVYLSTGDSHLHELWPIAGMSSERGLAHTTGGHPDRVMIDVNADGLPDIVDRGGCSSSNHNVKVALNRGAGFAAAIDWTVPSWANCELGDTVGSHNLRLLDFDGDGYLDMLKTDGERVRVSRNLAGAWCSPGSAATGCAASTEVKARDAASGPDLLVAVNNPLGGSTELAYRPLSEWTEGVGIGTPLKLWTVTRIESDDGRCRGASCLGAGAHSVSRTYEYADARFDVGEREFRGFGSVWTHDLDGDAPGSISQPLKSLRTSFFQDRYRKGKEAQTEEYVRDGAQPRFHRSRQFTWECADPLSGTAIDCTTSRADAWIRLADDSSIVSEGSETARTNTHVHQWHSCADGPSFRPQEVASGGILLNGAPDGLRVFTTTDYQCRDTLNGYYIKPVQTIVRASDNATQLSNVRYQYDVGRGNLVAIASWIDKPAPSVDYATCSPGAGIPSGAKCTTVSYTYDGYGLPSSVTDANGKQTSIEYDSTTHLYPSLITSPLGHKVSTAFDPACGVPQWQSTPYQGSPSLAQLPKYQWFYDPFCRLSRRALPGQTQASSQEWYTYVIGRSGEMPMRIQVKRREPNAASLYVSRVSSFDALGRPFHQIEDRVIEGVPGWVAQVTEYDERGYPVRASVPFDASGNPIGYAAPPSGTGFMTAEFDDLGRQRRTILPDGNERRTIFPSPRIVESTDECFSSPTQACPGAKDRAVVDAFGRTIEQQRYKDGAVYARTKYVFDEIGRLLETMQGSSSTWNEATKIAVSYDSLGRRLSLQDPDSGTWRYGYDPAGNEIYEDDPEPGRYLRLCYDAMNRLTRKLTVVGDTTNLGAAGLTDCSASSGWYAAPVDYSYDRDPYAASGNQDIANGLGRLLRVDDGSGTTRVGAFDVLGNPLRLTKGIRMGVGTPKWVAFEYGYDETGRLKTVKYPDGEQITYGFDAVGEAKSLTSSHRTYVSDISYDLFGRATRLLHGNGVSDQRLHHPDAAHLYRLHGLVVRKGAAAPYFSNVYSSYAPNGALTEIEDDAADGAMANDLRFNYDALGQLDSATWGTGASAVQIQYSHDVLGNLRRKERVQQQGLAADGLWLDYTDPHRPHRATAYRTSANGAATPIEYGQNGTRRSKGTDLYSYDAEDHLSEVSGASSILFSYDYSGRRVTSDDGATTIRHFSELADYSVGGGSSTLTKHYFAAGQRIASVSTSFVASDQMIASAPTQPAILFAALARSSGGLAIYLADNAASGVGWAGVAGIVALLSFPGRKRRCCGMKVRQGDVILLLALWSTTIVPTPLLVGAAYAGGGGSVSNPPSNNPTPSPTAPVSPPLVHYHADPIGSTQLVTDGAGAVVQQIRYSPFGEVRARFGSQADFRFEFTGYESNRSSGLQYADARFYDPQLGSFLSHDPAREFFDPYSYVGGDPVNRVDPSGTSSIRVICGGWSGCRGGDGGYDGGPLFPPVGPILPGRGGGSGGGGGSHRPSQPPRPPGASGPGKWVLIDAPCYDSSSPICASPAYRWQPGTPKPTRPRPPTSGNDASPSFLSWFGDSGLTHVAAAAIAFVPYVGNAYTLLFDEDASTWERGLAGGLLALEIVAPAAMWTYRSAASSSHINGLLPFATHIGSLTQSGLEHIVLRHWATSGASNAGKFLPGTSGRQLKRLIGDAVRYGTSRPNTRTRAGQIFEHQFPYQIGTNRIGANTNSLRVVLDEDGIVRTAFPY